MKENVAIKKIKLRIASAKHVVGAGIDGKAYEDLEIAIKAIEKQIPRKLYGNEWNPVVVGDTVSGFCPVCMTEFVCITPRMYKANNYGYCKACGQKIDWDD